MIYRNPFDFAQRYPSCRDKGCTAPPDSIEAISAQLLTPHSFKKEIAMQPNLMPEDPPTAYPHTTMATHEGLYPVSSHPPTYTQYAHHASGSCGHDDAPSVNRPWPTAFPPMHPPHWHHDSQIRQYDVPSAAMTFRPQPGGQASMTYVNAPNTDECVPFETYFPNDQPQGLGVLTPDQSPLAVTSTVPEDHDYSSSPPPKAESPGDNGNEDHSSLIQKVLVSSTPVMRSDGLKKKNAKFDIPKHRTIETIDTLINKEKDENVIKELKAQKRLLKNREAALQSRQRKKQRADDLEKQVMNLKEQLRRGSGYGEQLPHLNNGGVPRGHQADSIKKEIVNLRQVNQQLSNDKAKLMHTMASHNREVAELRNENERLLSQLHVKSDTPESASFASSDYSDVVENLDGIHFDNNIAYSDFSSDGNASTSKDGVRVPGSEMTQISPQLLATLLLYGAHIASATDNSLNNRGHIPILSPDDRVASKEMLETLFDHANHADRTQRSTSNAWRKSVNLAELARAYPRIVADLKSMFETPVDAQGAFIAPYNA